MNEYSSVISTIYKHKVKKLGPAVQKLINLTKWLIIFRFPCTVVSRK